MFARYDLCGRKQCQTTVTTELVEHETGTVLAKRSRACPKHKDWIATDNDVGDRELQEQAIAKLYKLGFMEWNFPSRKFHFAQDGLKEVPCAWCGETTGGVWNKHLTDCGYLLAFADKYPIVMTKNRARDGQKPSKAKFDEHVKV